MGVASDIMSVILDAAQGGSTPRRQRLFKGKVVYTTSGAIDSDNSKLPRGTTVTKPAGTGLYYLTLPTGTTIAGSVMHFDVSGGTDAVTGKSIADSTGLVYYTVYDGAGSAANATSGDYTTFLFVIEC